MNRNDRIRRLREVEVMCYRLCYSLLQSEKLAHAAAKELLLRLFRDEHFFTAAADRAAALLRREAAIICGIRLEAAAGME